MTIALAFSAGLLATVNPCGFAMLPAYLSYFLGAREEGPSKSVLARAAQGLVVGGIVAAGFVLVFGIAGILLAAGIRGVINVIPWLALGIGMALFVVGAISLSGRHVGLRLPAAIGPRRDRGYASVFVFGVAYAACSLSCTLPVFLTVVGTSLTISGIARLPVVFVFYAVGTTAVLMAVSMSAALARGEVVRMIKKAAPFIERASGLLLAIAGAYIVFYWTVNLADTDPESPVRAPIRALEGIQSAVAGWLASWGGALAGLLALALAAGVWGLIYWRRSAEPRGKVHEP